MDFSVYIMPVALVVALAVGFVLKAVWPGTFNRYLPLISAVIGLVVCVWANAGITPDIVAQGLISGLAATGCYELFAQFLKGPIESADEYRDGAIRKMDEDSQILDVPDDIEEDELA